MALRTDSLVGRTNELKRLHAFLASTRVFSWWAIIGSAGAGKSRLALELGLASEPGWFYGFLSESDQFDWNSWVPQKPTLLVADYGATR